MAKVKIELLRGRYVAGVGVPGQQVEVEDSEARSLIKGGYAKLLIPDAEDFLKASDPVASAPNRAFTNPLKRGKD